MCEDYPQIEEYLKKSKKTGFFDIFSSILMALEVLGVILAQNETILFVKKRLFFDTPGTPGGASIVERFFLSPNSHCALLQFFNVLLWQGVRL